MKYFSLLFALLSNASFVSSDLLRGNRQNDATYDIIAEIEAVERERVKSQNILSGYGASLDDRQKHQRGLQGSDNGGVTAVDDQVNTLENQRLLIKTRDLFENDSSTSMTRDEIDTMIYQTMTSPSFTGNIYSLEASLVPELHLFSFEPPQHGTLTRTTSGNLMYTPDQYFSGTDSFTYKATDGRGSFGEATVTIRVEDVENDPVANTDTFSIQEGTTELSITYDDLLENDVDPDQNGFKFVHITREPKKGTLAPDGEGWIYTPNPNFVGRDTFRYTLVDERNKEATALVQIYIE